MQIESERRQEEMDAQAAEQAELEAQAERERLRQEEEMRASGSNADEEVYGSSGAFLPTEKSIYFDYDMYKVKSEYADLVSKHGNYITSNSFYSIKLEGNCDERGGVEYNLALGDRRANSVKMLLLLLVLTPQELKLSVMDLRNRLHLVKMRRVIV